VGSTEEAVLPVGHVFAGRYRIKRFLGEGDRKRTYLADDTVFPREVALALIKPGAALSDPEGTRREAEALALAGRNDNVVTFHDSGTAEGTEYLVFDYLSGGTLRKYLAEQAEAGKQLPVEEVMRLGRRLARALAFVHELGLIHRDVAPGNVWLDERHLAHLGDFDSAVARDAALRPAALPPTTEAYTAPEQLRGTFDERSDLYSLGAVLYEALTGQRPKRVSRAAIAKRLTASRPDVPRSLRDTVSSLLAESPDERPGSAEEVLEALKPARVYRKVGEGLVPWADTLPFPLASILWHWEGEPREGGKVDYLIKFFEALAQLVATTLLSACARDSALLEANRSAWFCGEQRPLDLRTATFGMWVKLADRLSKTLRVLLRDDDEDRARELFAAVDIELVEALSAAKLPRILHHALACRNRWTGHGGVASKDVHRERLRELEDLLAQTRAVLGWSFETWTLLKPGPMTRSGKIYDLTATILKGPNSAFQRRQMKLTEALDTARLYLVNDGNDRALELLPFIRVLAGQTGQDACYFYNRLEGTEVRWISYHFHAEPELLLPDDGLVDLLTDIGAPYFAKQESDQMT
jgi:Protein kinase domain